MAKSVTVLALEGDMLRGVRLDAEGDDYVRGASASWSLLPPTGDGEEEVEPPTLASIFGEAVKTFGTRDFVLSLPLSHLLVKMLRLSNEVRDDLESTAQIELETISPFPDEPPACGVETMNESETDFTAVAASLPESDRLAGEISFALEESQVHVLRTDVTAVALLTSLWDRIVEKKSQSRRLVLLNVGGGWDFIVVDDDVPAFFRGIATVRDAAELGREIMLSLLSVDSSPREIDDVVVFTQGSVGEDVIARLGEFGPVRVKTIDDEFAGAEGAARRTFEADKLDITPTTWVDAREENRFRKKLSAWLSVAGALWLVVMAGLFGVDATYDFLASRERSAQKDKKHARAFRDVSAMTNRVVLIERYADHAHSALAVLKAVSDSLPQSEEIAFRTFQFRRDESVRVNGRAGEREELRTFTENLEKATYDDDGEDVLFAKVQQTGGETQTKNGISFAIECFFHEDDENAGGRR